MSKEVKRYGMCGFESGIVATEDGCFVGVDDYDTLLAERDALAKDAERYRWLSNPAHFHAAVSQQLWLLHGSPEFGERIDKAIGKGEQP